ncbi:hypothetical protein Avbf_02779 [Armadillidium vulgare]|nr:hypothetical protein Avbf_02779 [Armadillidium vulgare]
MEFGSKRDLISCLMFLACFLLWQSSFKFQNEWVRIKADPRNHNLKYILKPPPKTKMDKVDDLSPSVQSSYLVSLRNSYKRLTRSLSEDLGEFRSNKISSNESVFPGKIMDNMTLSRQLQGKILQLVDMVTVPKRICKKLVRFGGRFCRKLPGAKSICLDNDVKPPLKDCLVYSFGVGHDFSFDGSALQYGCEVFAFDDDESHRKYPIQMAYGDGVSIGIIQWQYILIYLSI